MDRRADLQSRLQRILEVISVVALTYYLAVLLDVHIDGGEDGGRCIERRAYYGRCNTISVCDYLAGSALDAEGRGP